MTNITIPRGNYAFDSSPRQAPEFAALSLMVNDVLSSSPMSRSDALMYVLAWFAAVKLLVNGEIKGYQEYSDLLHRDCWEAAERSGLPNEVTTLVWSLVDNGRVQDWVNVKLLGLLANYVEQFDTQQGEFSDVLAEIRASEIAGYDGGLCDVIIDLLQAPQGSEVWIPFDETGQLTVRALKRGLKVVLDGPRQDPWAVLVIRLLAILAGRSEMLSTDTCIEQVCGREVDRVFDYMIACPPLGMRLQSDASWRRWEGCELGLAGSEAIYKQVAGQILVQLDRSELWAIAALWPHIRLKAVFLTGINLLFAKGKEQRLREFMVLGQQQPSVVVTLPPRLLHHTGIPVALTVLDRDNTKGAVRLVDSNSMTSESKSTMRFIRQLNSAEVLYATQCQEDIDDVAKTVLLEDVAAQECNLMPVRYLKALASDDIDRVPLGDLVDLAIRAPVASKEATSVEAQEIGIVDLDRWGELNGPFLKTTRVQAKKIAEYNLQPADLIISIKGTIGKVGIVGDGANKTGPVVCGQTVVAIRPRKSKVSAVALYLYLKSDDFRGQLEAFRLGAVIAHVTPTTLLQEVRVPKHSLLDHATANARYAELCSLECDAEIAYQRIEEIRRSLDNSNSATHNA